MDDEIELFGTFIHPIDGKEYIAVSRAEDVEHECEGCAFRPSSGMCLNAPDCNLESIDDMVIFKKIVEIEDNG